MQAKANEPIVSIERFFFKISPLHAHTPSSSIAILELFETTRRTRALFIITSNLFAQSPA